MGELKAGLIVVLKSGRPKMTVLRILSTDNSHDEYLILRKGYKVGDVICQWFENEALKEGVFAKESLTVVEEEK